MDCSMEIHGLLLFLFGQGSRREPPLVRCLRLTKRTTMSAALKGQRGVLNWLSGSKTSERVMNVRILARYTGM